MMMLSFGRGRSHVDSTWLEMMMGVNSRLLTPDSGSLHRKTLAHLHPPTESQHRSEGDVGCLDVDLVHPGRLIRDPGHIPRLTVRTIQPGLGYCP